MALQRFFVDPEIMSGEEIDLPPDVLHHLGTVLRRGAGEEILLLDGGGEICRCQIMSLQRRSGTARVMERWRERETAFPLTLLQGVPKGDKMDLVLQKGTELGIARFIPLLTERSVARISPQKEEQRLQRWNRIVREAARQSRRVVLPEVQSPRSLEAAIDSCRDDLRLFFWEEEQRPLAAALNRSAPHSAAILVGPEGGISSGEAKILQQGGFESVSLGPRILRSETAGFAVASILQHRFGDLGSPT